MSNTFRGVLSIDTDEAGLEATITWIPDPGGTVYSKAKILEELYARDIKHGIDEQALTEFCAEAQSAGDGSLSGTHYSSCNEFFQTRSAPPAADG